MTALFYYLLKVSLCSGVLFVYYHLSLRNRLFHRWNRFYLLSSVVLSLLLPLVQFRLTRSEDDWTEAWRFLQSLQQADHTLEKLVVVGGNQTAPEHWMTLAFGLVSFLLLLKFLRSLWQIQRIINAHTVQTVEGIKFVNTTVPGTPFSFFRYIFWNKDISLQSATGQQIFQHEKVHVDENHTADKLFLQLVLLFFWCNPFFWLIRKELHYIHEFIADQKAVNDKDAFAAMILQATYPQQYASIINPFFQNSIKRRIAMLTKNRKPGLTYISRIIALPIVATVIFAFTVREKPDENSALNRNKNDRNDRSLIQPAWGLRTDTVPKKEKEISAVDVRKDSGKKMHEISITYTDGTKETMSGEEAAKRGLVNNSGYGNVTRLKVQKSSAQPVQIRDTAERQKQPLFILDGKEITKEEMETIDPKKIEAINVLKDKSATEKYGDKGKNGVVEITMKKAPNGRVTG